MAKSPKGNNSNYSVGRGKPPQHTRFKPGQSGNPSGRRRGATNLKTVLADVLGAHVELTENGCRRSVPLLEALVLRQAQEGLGGRTSAIDSLLDRYERHVGTGPESLPELEDEDRALLARAMKRKESSHD